MKTAVKKIDKKLDLDVLLFEKRLEDRWLGRIWSFTGSIWLLGLEPTRVRACERRIKEKGLNRRVKENHTIMIVNY